MTVSEFIKEIETNHLEDAIEKLARNPKDLVTVYLGAKEFEQAKLQRTSAAPLEHDDSDITIRIVNSKEEINAD